MRFSRVIPIAVAAALVAVAGALMGAPRALAYGSADQPIAQLELSQNCMNPTLCGLAGAKGGDGAWVWIEIDANGTGDVSGAGCGHLQGLGAGGGPIHGPITWHLFTGSTADLVAAHIQPVATDPHGNYYVVDQAGLAFPTTVGHYSSMPAPGISTQLTVAP